MASFKNNVMLIGRFVRVVEEPPISGNVVLHILWTFVKKGQHLTQNAWNIDVQRVSRGLDDGRTSNLHLTHISRSSNFLIPNYHELYFSGNLLLLASCLLLLKFHPLWEEGNYGSLRWKLWQFLVKSASNANSGNVKRWERLPWSLGASTAFSVF